MPLDNQGLHSSLVQQDVKKALQQDLDEVLQQLRNDKEASSVYFGLSPSDAYDINQTLEEAAASGERLMDVRIALKTKSTDELAASAHIQNVKGDVQQVSHVKASRNQAMEDYSQQYFEDMAQSGGANEIAQRYETTDPARQARRHSYATHIQNQLDMGATIEDIRFQLDNRKIWDTFTPHPTKEKNNFAQKSIKSLIDSKAKTAFGVLEEIVKNPLSPRIKDNLSDETNTGLDVLDTCIDGGLDYLEDMQWALYNRFEANDIAPEQRFDLLDLGIDIAPRDWYAGDADGKLVPAEVLFSKRLQGAIKGAEKYLEIFNAVPREDRPALSEAIKSFESLAYRLGKIESDPNKLTGDALTEATRSFSEAFSERGFHGLDEDIGPAWTGNIMKELRKISKDESFPDSVRQAAKRAALMHKQVGISIGRQEVRHSGDDLNQIFQNAYEYLAENPELAKDLKIKKGSELPELSEVHQIQFYKAFINLKDRRKLLEAANEGKLKGPAAEVLRRFNVLHDTFNQRRMGVAIIAEANPMSCIQQQILAEAYHINGMTHCALNEDQDTIKMAAANLRTYLENFGHNNLKIKIQEVEGENGHPDVYVCVMDPASDSQKSWGAFMKGAQIQSRGEVTKLGMEFNIAALGKDGTGMSYARGGFPAVMAPRLTMHAITKLMDISELSDEMSTILKKQLSFASVTIQGRGPNLMRSSREHVQDQLAKIGFEMDLMALAVDGHIDAKEVAPLSPKYSAAMQKFLDGAEQDARDHYYEFIRNEPSNEVLGENVENRHTKSVSATIMALLTNVSARKASRDDSDNKVELVKNKEVDGQRAIGQNVIKEWSETLYDGWFEVGTFLSSARQAKSEGKISAKQIKLLQSDQIFTRHKWGNAILSLAKADFEWGFDKHSMDKGEYSEERWTVEKLLKAKDNNFEGLDEIERRQAHIAYEGLLASSHFEAFFEGFAEKKSERETILSIYNESDTLDRVKFGPKTMAFYPVIEPTQTLAREDRLARAMAHEGERRLREKEAKGEFLEEGTEETKKYRHIAMTRRAASGPITLPNLMDRFGVTFGARKESVIDFLSKKAALKREPANENILDAEEPGLRMPA